MSKPAPAPKNNLKQQSYELINMYFDVEDKIKNYRQVKAEIESKHNISITPVPDCFKGIPENLTKTFDLIANNAAEVKAEDIDQLKESIVKIDEELEGWMEKVTLAEIKLQKIKKNGMEYHLIDPNLRKLIKTVEKLKRDDYDFENDEEEIGIGTFGFFVSSDKKIDIQEASGGQTQSGRLVTEVIAPEPETPSVPQDPQDPAALTDEELIKCIEGKLDEGARKSRACLEKLSKLSLWSKAKEIEKELYFVLNSGSDADYIRTLQIDEEKFTNLENDVHQLEKKAANLEGYFEKFEEKYLKDPKRRTVVKKNEIEQKISDFSHKISCVRNLKRSPSDSCLQKRSALTGLIQGVESRRAALRLLHFIHEGTVVVHEPAAKNITTRLEVADLKRKFMGKARRKSQSGEAKGKSVDELMEAAGQIQDEEFKKLMREHLEKIKANQEDSRQKKQTVATSETKFGQHLEKIMEKAKAEMAKARKFLGEEVEAA